ncbi:hypothetical protein N0V85_009644 [Neurospora sp. IMI 360204]|nr:hypothetical protein N0V85_009644 [Neurospora sp. IMI 360204]
MAAFDRLPLDQFSEVDAAETNPRWRPGFGAYDADLHMWMSQHDARNGSFEFVHQVIVSGGGSKPLWQRKATGYDVAPDEVEGLESNLADLISHRFIYTLRVEQ